MARCTGICRGVFRTLGVFSNVKKLKNKHQKQYR